MKFLLSLLLSVVFISSANVLKVSSQTKNVTERDLSGRTSSEILLPNEQGIGDFLVSADSSFYKSQDCLDFLKKHGRWDFLIDRVTGNIHRAFGDAIKLQGFDTINNNNVELASMKFLKENSSFLRINPNDLKLLRKTKANNRWYVSYVQYFQGYEVLLSEIELRIFQNGNLMAFGVDFYRDINPDLAQQKISAVAAGNYSKIGLTYNPQTVKTHTEDRIYILPVKTDSNITYHLVYKTNIEIPETYAHYFSYTDAITGKVLWRQNQTMMADSKINITGAIKEKTGNDPDFVASFQNQRVHLANQDYFTDSLGNINLNMSGSNYGTIGMNGRWAYISRSDSSRNAKIKTEIVAGNKNNLIWDNSNSLSFERNTYYHSDKIHQIIKDLDSNMVMMDFPLNVILDFTDPISAPNAYSDVKNIVFTGIGNDNSKYPDAPSVLYHEYGHSINALLFMSLGKPEGMLNSACNEGSADAFACLVLDTNFEGLGSYSDSYKFIRNLKNINIYPDSISIDPHTTGLILSGAIWDFRDLTSTSMAIHDFHYAKYGCPDDPNLGTAFSEWLLEMLIADDDDGNLGNGTPHIQQMVQAFNNHHIGLNLVLQSGFEHNPLPDSRDTINPYPVLLRVNMPNFSLVSPDSVRLFYSINSSQNYSNVEMISNGSGLYTANIPAQHKGSLIRYYFKYFDKWSGSAEYLYNNPAAQAPYFFLVGYNIAVDKDFETNKNWKVGGGNDDADQGIWELNIPDTINYSGLIQPGYNRLNDGMKCFVTGAKFSQTNPNFPNGETTLFSPVYDLSSLNSPLASCWIWFSYFSPFGNGFDEFSISFSDDGGLSWTTVYQIMDPTNGWEREIFNLKDYTTKTNGIKFKFIFWGNNYNYLMYLSKGLLDDFQILSLDDYLDVRENHESGVHGVQIISVSPLPVDDNFELTFNLESPGTAYITIYNESGMVCAQIETEQLQPGINSLRIKEDDINLTGPGAYYFRISSGASSAFGKFIKI